jgi:catechol 2,3-dioxygenase-like lactoylglutathione lyase family enzyme
VRSRERQVDGGHGLDVTVRCVSGAHHVVHVNLNTADAAAAAGLYTALGLAVGMRTSSEPVDGALYGVRGTRTHSDATFLYDDRGPRRASALELQEWHRPRVTGEPYDDLRTWGIQALGLAVPSLEGVADAVRTAGGTVVGERRGALLRSAPRTLWVRDRDCVLLELIEEHGVPSGRLHRLVISTDDIDAALGFYGALGFEQVAHERLSDASDVFPTAAANDVVDAYELRLPEDHTFFLLLLAWERPVVGACAYAEPWHRGLYRFALAVDDVRGEHERVAAAGVDVVTEPTDVPMAGTPVGALTVCFLSDPGGVAVELVERPRSAFAGSDRQSPVT